MCCPPLTGTTCCSLRLRCSCFSGSGVSAYISLTSRSCCQPPALHSSCLGWSTPRSACGITRQCVRSSSSSCRRRGRQHGQCRARWTGRGGLTAAVLRSGYQTHVWQVSAAQPWRVAEAGHSTGASLRGIWCTTAPAGSTGCWQSQQHSPGARHPAAAPACAAAAPAARPAPPPAGPQCYHTATTAAARAGSAKAGRQARGGACGSVQAGVVVGVHCCVSCCGGTCAEQGACHSGCSMCAA
jgi:hypothetical protein